MKNSRLVPIVPGLLAAAALAVAAFSIDTSAASADDPALATTGSADASGRTFVWQKNVQVIAGQGSAENSSQTASNEVDIEQENLAASGDATASDGGTASSGDARAASTAVVTQLNVQIIAGRDCSADQAAHNMANVNQTSMALSGDATAEGSGSNASSGNATATNRGSVHQRNLQVYVCTPNGSGGGQQSASNTGNLDQLAGAASGDADATGGSNVSSGNATSRNIGTLNQANRQITID